MISPEVLFNSIYKNFDTYVSIVDRVLGNNNHHSSNIVSSCIEKLHTRSQSGKLNLDDITYNGAINRSYFTTVILNAALSYVGSREWKLKSYNVPPQQVIEPYKEPKYDEEDLRFILKKMERYKLTNRQAKFHYEVFQWHFIQGWSLRRIARESGVGNRTIRRSRIIIREIIREWLRKKESR